MVKHDAEIVRAIRAAKLTYLVEARLASIACTCRSLEAGGIPGLFLEAGCALGGSTILIASAKSGARPLRVYDVFGMIPPPTEQDPPEVHERYETIARGASEGIDGDRYYGYESNLYEIVASNLRTFGIDLQRDHVSLIKGLVQDTMEIDGPVAFAHIDVDWYEPVRACLERIVPCLSVGGVLILDDYSDWGGCRKATEEYFAGRNHLFERDDSVGPLRITRVRS